MIGFLRGILAERGTDHVLLDVSGVGYVVYCSDRTIASLPGTGSVVSLYTDMLVREDLLQLYGFGSVREREFHRLLITVQGVGARAALAIVAALGVDAAIRAIVLQDANAIQSAQGVGPKLAQRVVNELTEKAAALMALAGTGPEVSADSAAEGDTKLEAGQAERPVTAPQTSAAAEAISALLNLGYQQVEAAGAVAEVARDDADLGTPELIREALKRLAPG